jgi:putative peptide zinc metalloprotease protein
MNSTLPKFRSDLIVSQHRTHSGLFVVVKDPVGGQFFRFGEVEQFILGQLDGTRSLDEVRSLAESHFGAELSQETLTHFLGGLNRSGLLEGEKASRPRPAFVLGKFHGNALLTRLPLYDPTRIMNWLLPRTRLFFTRGFVMLSAAVISAGIVTLASDWNGFVQDLGRLYQLSSLGPLIVVMLVMVSLHEFAHGMACRRFGGEVHEIGFMFVYFQPAFYCNVSDAWLFPERSKRLWVGFAGPYFELFLWALAVLVWRVTAGDAWINALAVIVMAVSGVKTLLNFNPLIKLDGYYLLSDFLDIPNLRKKSFRHIGDLLKRLVGWSEPPVSSASPHERRVFLIYGMVATVYSMTLLVFVALKTGGFLIDNGQPLALGMFGVLAGAKFRRRVRRLMGTAAAHTDDDIPGTSPPDDAPSSAGAPIPARVESKSVRNPARVEPKSAPIPARVESKSAPIPARVESNGHGGAHRSSKGALSSMSRRRLLILGAAALLLVLLLGRMELRASGPVSVLPQENADIRAAVTGIVEEIYVDEGDRVRAGDPIARLSSVDLETNLHATEAEVRELHAIVQGLVNGPTNAEIQVARATLAKTEAAADYAATQLARDSQLFQLGAVPRTQLDDARAAVTKAGGERLEAQRRLNVLLVGTRPDEIEAARARLERLESQQSDLSQQYAKLKVVSPVAGIVATPSRDLKAMKRQLISTGGLIAKVYDYETVAAQIRVPEKSIGEVRAGQQVELRTRADPNTTFYGRVKSIAVAADATPVTEAASPLPVTHSGGDKVFIVTSLIDNRSLFLRPGMTGQAKVLCGKRSVIDLVTRQLARTLNVEVWSWW